MRRYFKIEPVANDDYNIGGYSYVIVYDDQKTDIRFHPKYKIEYHTIKYNGYTVAITERVIYGDSVKLEDTKMKIIQEYTEEEYESEMKKVCILLELEK